MKRFKRVFAISMLVMICSANIAFAVPVKVDEDSPRQNVEATQKPKETESSKATVKPTEKPAVTEKATASPKATTKPTEKPSPSPKATAKATEKATTKPTAEADNDDKIVLDADDEAIVLEPTAEPTINIQNGSEQLENKKYLTKFGAFLWFLFTVIVSAVISFAISYRFYMMGKRDNHLLSEIRALKRDIDSKMVGSVGGFSEYDISVSNGNRSYAGESSSIHSSAESSVSTDDSEIYKKWESKLGNSSTGQRNDRTTGNNPRQTGTVNRRRPVNSSKSVGGKIKKAFTDFLNNN